MIHIQSTVWELCDFLLSSEWAFKPMPRRKDDRWLTLRPPGDEGPAVPVDAKAIYLKPKGCGKGLEQVVFGSISFLGLRHVARQGGRQQDHAWRS